MTICPCRPGQLYAACCGRAHSGESPAVTAEALMRSRYSAFAMQNANYLIASWHTTTRPQQVEFSGAQTWTGLEIVDVSGGGMLDHTGIVEFIASYEIDGVARQLRERSNFVRESNRWVYVDGLVRD